MKEVFSVLKIHKQPLSVWNKDWLIKDTNVFSGKVMFFFILINKKGRINKIVKAKNWLFYLQLAISIG